MTSLHIAEDIEVHKHSPEAYRGVKLTSTSSGTKDIVLVAEDDDNYVCGYFWAVALRIFDYKIGIIFDLYVDSKMRHKGFGRKLLKEGIDELHKLGVHRIWANLDKKNAPTLSLIQHLGFMKSEDKAFYQLVDPEAKHDWGKE